MDILWSKYSAPDIDALITQFRTALDQAEALGKDKIVSWAQQEVESNKLNRKLHDLKNSVHSWRDYRPHGKDRWMLFSSLTEEKEKLMDKWRCHRESEHMEKASSGRHNDSKCDKSEVVKVRDVGGENAISGHTTPTGDSLPVADNIALSQLVTSTTTTPPVNAQPVVVTSPSTEQEAVQVTKPPPLLSPDGASIITSTPLTTTGAPQQTLPLSLRSHPSYSGLNAGFALPPSLTSTPHLQNTRVTPPVDLSMGQGSSMPYSNSGAHDRGDFNYQWARPKIRLTPISLPKFSRDRRDYWRWKAEWESIQAQAEPTGSRECKKLHLLDSLDEAVKNKLRLLRCRDASDIFRELENRYGDIAQTAEEIVLELQSRPAVKNHQPKETLELILAVERAALDLTDLGCIDAIQNQLVIRSLESKLPDFMKREWLMFVNNPDNCVNPGNRFNVLLQFLAGQKSLLVRLEQLLPSKLWPVSAPERPSYHEKHGNRKKERKSFTKTAASEVRPHSQQTPCSVCGDQEHGKKLFHCKTFKKFNLSEKKAHVKKLKACFKCLDVHGTDGTCTPKFLCRKEECKKGYALADHHYFLCPKALAKKDAGKKESKVEEKRGPRGPTEEQEAVFAELVLTP